MAKKTTHEKIDAHPPAKPEDDPGLPNPFEITRMPTIPPFVPSLGRIVLYVSPEQGTTVAPVVCPAILCAEPETMDSKQWGLTIFDMLGPRCVWAQRGKGPGEFFGPME